MKILIAEDDPVSLKVLETILKKLGNELITATNGREAIEALNRESQIDLIISDIMMPEIDGFGLLKFVKSKNKFNKIPVILATAVNDISSVQTALKNGVVGYLVKPITKDLLVSKLDEISQNLPPSILVVDDEEIIRSLLKRVIEIDGYRVVTASNGVEALNIIKHKNINLVISDIKMPEMTGVELLKEIITQELNMKVVLMTGLSLEVNKDQALTLGAADYISKPFNNTEILEKIRKYYTEETSLKTA